jgi:hypothetical protein
MKIAVESKRDALNALSSVQAWVDGPACKSAQPSVVSLALLQAITAVGQQTQDRVLRSGPGPGPGHGPGHDEAGRT